MDVSFWISTNLFGLPVFSSLQCYGLKQLVWAWHSICLALKLVSWFLEQTLPFCNFTKLSKIVGIITASPLKHSSKTVHKWLCFSHRQLTHFTKMYKVFLNIKQYCFMYKHYSSIYCNLLLCTATTHWILNPAHWIQIQHTASEAVHLASHTIFCFELGSPLCVRANLVPLLPIDQVAIVGA